LRVQPEALPNKQVSVEGPVEISGRCGRTARTQLERSLDVDAVQTMKKRAERDLAIGEAPSCGSQALSCACANALALRPAHPMEPVV
jgi:hypothetical protein